MRNLIAAFVLAMTLGITAPAAAGVTGACHVSPVVADLDRSMRFYRDLLGLEVSPAAADGRSRRFTARIPGFRCGIEPVEFTNVDRQPAVLRMQDPGAVTLILIVRDIDAAFARLRAGGVTVVSTGGAPVTPSPTSKTRAVIVRDPDGHFVELAQLVPQPATAVPASSNIIDIRFRVTVGDLDDTVRYFQEHLGIPGKPGSFAASQGVMAMMGLPPTVEYRLSMTPIPGSTLILEFLELKGLDRAPSRLRVQDPGAYQLQLIVDDVSAPLVMPDLNNLFLVLQPAAGTSTLSSFHVQGNVWVITGAGGNITVQVSDAAAEGPGAGEGVLLVDTGRKAMSAAVLAEIRKISPKRIEYIINTHVDPEHAGGNELFAVPRMDFLWTPGTITGPGVKVLGHENILPRMSATTTGGQPAYPSIAWPTYTYSTPQRKLFFNDEPIVVMHAPSARTDGDSMVFFRRSDVISAGDIFLTTTYPVVDRERGGSLAGIISGLNQLIDLMVPRYNQNGGTYVIPGHGRVADQHDVLEYRDMLVIISDRIRSGVSKGQTLAQIKAARPTLDYDARWGATSGAWTTEMFINAVYAEVGGR